MSRQDIQIVEAIDARGRGLRATFEWRGDRYRHTIAALDADDADTLLISQEGADRDDWPPSPPLQSLTIEERAHGQRVALLIGMAGRSHWSVCLEAEPDTRALLFDVACRVNEKPARLGSSYQVVDSTDVQSETDFVLMRTPKHKMRIARVEPDTKIQFDAGLISASLPAAVSSLPVTLRWKYRVELK